MSDDVQKQSEREAHLHSLAGQLQFTVEKTGDRFTLMRTADVSPPEREEGLTLEQAVRLLQPIFKCWNGHCQTCQQPVDLDQLALHHPRQNE